MWASTPTLSILTLSIRHFQKCHFQIFSEMTIGTILTLLEKIFILTLSRMTLSRMTLSKMTVLKVYE